MQKHARGFKLVVSNSVVKTDKKAPRDAFWLRPNGVLRPEIEDALKDPKKWNVHWEGVLDPKTNGGMDFSPQAWYEDDIEEFKAMRRQHPHSLNSIYDGYPPLYQQTLALQIAIIQDIFTLRNRGFDARWRAADPRLREEHALLALSRTCASANNLHEARRLCATELNLAYLTKDGRNVINLLKVLIPQDLSTPPSSLSYFPHPDWDTLRDFHEKTKSSDMEEFAYRWLLILRTKLICHVLQAMYRSFLGLAVPNIQTLKEHSVREELERDLRVKSRPPPGAQICRVGCNSKICPNGLHDWTDIPKGKVFLRCKDCWEKQHREVKYCSRECQKADWKPNHKAICGKPLDFNTAAGLATSSSSLIIRRNGVKLTTPVIGPATPGFERSLNLSYHISELGVFRDSDYIFMPSPETIEMDPEIVGHYHIQFPDPEFKRLFRVVRDKALTTGEREAVAILAHALCWWVSRDKYSGPVTPDIVADQIHNEFSFDEVKKAVEYMEERQIRDSYRRPPFLFQMDPTRWLKTMPSFGKQQPIVFK
ncbi:hypothetical protein B0H19DRAFT_67869 [Mycena capillaripes]|nr:hypothetical protein B0H19DRAFT_67869 [Mycena capillaripes]